MLVEALVLHRHHGLMHILGQVCDADRGPTLEAELGDLLTVCGKDLALLLVFERGDPGDGRAGLTRAQVLPCTPGPTYTERSDEADPQEVLSGIPESGELRS